jgi:hypothetical protein
MAPIYIHASYRKPLLSAINVNCLDRNYVLYELFNLWRREQDCNICWPIQVQRENPVYEVPCNKNPVLKINWRKIRCFFHLGHSSSFLYIYNTLLLRIFCQTWNQKPLDIYHYFKQKKKVTVCSQGTNFTKAENLCSVTYQTTGQNTPDDLNQHKHHRQNPKSRT